MNSGVIMEQDVINSYIKRGPDPRTSSTPRSATINGVIPHIDIFNIDDECFDECKYVLTSPRSLEACSRLSIQPVELLYKPLTDYQRELLPQCYSLREIYDMYAEGEKERQSKLQMCRVERDTVIEEDMKLGIYHGPMPEQQTLDTKKPEAKNKSKPKKTVRIDDENVDMGSIQRKRTAWATAVGHDRVSLAQLNNRASELFKAGRDAISTAAHKQTKTRVPGAKIKRRPQSAPV